MGAVLRRAGHLVIPAASGRRRTGRARHEAQGRCVAGRRAGGCRTARHERLRTVPPHQGAARRGDHAGGALLRHRRHPAGPHPRPGRRGRGVSDGPRRAGGDPGRHARRPARGPLPPRRRGPGRADDAAGRRDDGGAHRTQPAGAGRRGHRRDRAARRRSGGRSRPRRRMANCTWGARASAAPAPTRARARPWHDCFSAPCPDAPASRAWSRPNRCGKPVSSGAASPPTPGCCSPAAARTSRRSAWPPPVTAGPIRRPRCCSPSSPGPRPWPPNRCVHPRRNGISPSPCSTASCRSGCPRSPAPRSPYGTSPPPPRPRSAATSM